MQSSVEETVRRVLSDRRKRPTPLMSRYSFLSGRRKTIRRERDKEKHIFVDLYYSNRLLITILVFLTLNLIDSYFTLTLIEENIAAEINPIMNFFLGYGITPFIVAKFFITSVPLIILCLCKNCSLTKILLVFALLFYLLIIFHELNLMYQFLPVFEKSHYVF